MSSANTTRKIHDAEAQVRDPGASGTIVVNESLAICNLISLAAESRTLALPTRAGVLVTLHMQTDGGDITLTVASAYNENGDTTFTFSEVGQTLTLQSFQTSGGVYFWRTISHYGIANRSVDRIVTVTDAATYAVLAANSGKTHIVPNLTADCTITMPTAAAGLEYTFISKAVAADAQNWIFSTGGANFWLGGLAFADTDAGAGADEIHAGLFPNGSSNDFVTIVTPSAGTRIHVVCDGTNWIINGQVFSATVPTASDT